MSWFSRLTSHDPPPGSASLPIAALRTDPGCRRTQNEDSACAVTAGAGPHGDRGLLLVVADGMGGHEAGEVASRIAVQVIARAYREAKGTPGEALLAAFHRAHQQIFEMSSRNPAMNGMGTTCTALALAGGNAWSSHVGDSRLYLVRQGALYQLSEDQTQCMEMVRRGILTLEEAERHEDRNILAHAMGTRPELAAVSWSEPMPVYPGDRFILCSDGLHDLVSNAEIREVASGAEPREACEKLVKMARERGGYDNITVVMALVPGEPGSLGLMNPTREFGVSA